MNVEIVTIGDELLLGFTIDTNASWLARELSALGIAVTRRGTVGDDSGEIRSSVQDALARSGAVITTGGLGPTADDLTKPAIASIFGRELYFDDVQWERIRRLWRERGRSGDPPEVNRQQVMLPAGAEVLVNRQGTAPGLLLTDERGRWVAMLPGVPREMRGMFTDALSPRLRQRLAAGDAAPVIRSRTVRTTGIAESQLPTRLGDAAAGLQGLSLAYLPGHEGVDLRLTARGLPADQADARLEHAASELSRRLGTVAYARDNTDLAEVLLQLCRDQRLTIAVAESCTGGMLGARLTAIPGSSDVFLGGVIAYHNDAKSALLGVSRETLAAHGAVSGQVASEMASGAKRATGAAIGISITGIAGPGGGTDEKPVGLVWIAAEVLDQRRAFGARMIGDRAEIRVRATQAALDLVRRLLLGADLPEWPGRAAQPLPNAK